LRRARPRNATNSAGSVRSSHLYASPDHRAFIRDHHHHG
jgi:hypothetical protein